MYSTMKGKHPLSPTVAAEGAWCVLETNGDSRKDDDNDDDESCGGFIEQPTVSVGALPDPCNCFHCLASRVDNHREMPFNFEDKCTVLRRIGSLG